MFDLILVMHCYVLHCNTKMDGSLIQLLIWMIAYEINKDRESKDNQQNLYHRLSHLLSEECNNRANNDDPLPESLTKLGVEMIHFYYDHFIEESDGTMKLIESEIPLMNGRYKREFRNMKFIATGAFGKVHRSVNVLDHKEYAIKEVPLYGTEYN